MRLEDVKLDIGISETGRKEIAQRLSQLLADSYTLLLKTHNYHWNVTGPMFQTLHVLFEQQYTELTLAVDLIAERIRALGVFAPGSYAEFLKLTTIKESSGAVPNATKMIQDLVGGHETAARTARESFKVVGKYEDAASEDLLTQRVQAHEKAAWMLRSLL